MDSEDIGFELTPELEELDEELSELIDNGEVGQFHEYGFESYEQMLLYYENLVEADRAYDMLQETEASKWESFVDTYDEAGGVIYNPENTDEYYTDKTSLSTEDLDR